MRIAVLGANGQVGRCLRAAHWPDGMDVVTLARADLDLAMGDDIAPTLARIAPELIINAAAYTAVDRAESERDLAFAVNATAVGAIGAWAAPRGVPVLHISTDYVFDGQGTRPYVETDPTGPLGVYGASKLAGEDLLRLSGAPHITLRTSWVYAVHGNNFIRTMQRLGHDRDVLRVVADQHGTPTAAEDIAAALIAMAHRVRTSSPNARAALWGTYHYTATGETTWHGLAEAVFEDMQRTTGRRPLCQAITSAEYPTPARRPTNSRLDCSAFDRVFALARPHWRDAVARMLASPL